MAGAGASKARAPGCRAAQQRGAAGAGQEPASLRSSARSHQRPRPAAGASAGNAALASFHTLLAPSRRPASAKEVAGDSGVPRSGTGAGGRRAELPAPSDGMGRSVTDLAAWAVTFSNISAARWGSVAAGRAPPLTSQTQLSSPPGPAQPLPAPGWGCATAGRRCGKPPGRAAVLPAPRGSISPPLVF